jgi:uncharacterized protein
LATISSGRCFFRRLVVIESLLARRAVDLHIRWIRISKPGHDARLYGHLEGDATLQACWDADRLDLGRVGITPSPRRLCTDAARSLLDWSHDRAVSGFVPRHTLASWGIADTFIR